MDEKVAESDPILTNLHLWLVQESVGNSTSTSLELGAIVLATIVAPLIVDHSTAGLLGDGPSR